MNVPFLTNEEIEQQVTEELDGSGYWPENADTPFNIESFLTEHLKAHLDQDALLPSDVMGEVKFQRGKKPFVRINRDLTYRAESNEKNWIIGRWRMTVAHESVHIILHRVLFLLAEDQGSLWEDNEPRIHRCYKRNLIAMGVHSPKDLSAEEFAAEFGWNSGRLLNSSKQTKSLEYQANRGAAALLMPRALFVDEATKLFDHVNAKFPMNSPQVRQQCVIDSLAEQFSVSRQASQIRCSQLQLLGICEQAVINSTP